MTRTTAAHVARSSNPQRPVAAPAVTLSAKPFGHDPVSVVSTRLVGNDTLRVELQHTGNGKGDAYALRWDGTFSGRLPPVVELVVERRKGSTASTTGKTQKAIDFDLAPIINRARAQLPGEGKVRMRVNLTYRTVEL